jgi:hypothetical protein
MTTIPLIDYPAYGKDWVETQQAHEANGIFMCGAACKYTTIQAAITAAAASPIYVAGGSVTVVANEGLARFTGTIPVRVYVEYVSNKGNIATRATGTFGAATKYLYVTANEPGTAGNAITVALTAGGVLGATITGTAITITYVADTTTPAAIESLLNSSYASAAYAAINKLVTISGNLSAVALAAGDANTARALTGGTDWVDATIQEYDDAAATPQRRPIVELTPALGLEMFGKLAGSGGRESSILADGNSATDSRLPAPRKSSIPCFALIIDSVDTGQFSVTNRNALINAQIPFSLAVVANQPGTANKLTWAEIKYACDFVGAEILYHSNTLNEAHTGLPATSDAAYWEIDQALSTIQTNTGRRVMGSVHGGWTDDADKSLVENARQATLTGQLLRSRVLCHRETQSGSMGQQMRPSAFSPMPLSSRFPATGVAWYTWGATAVATATGYIQQYLNNLANMPGCCSALVCHGVQADAGTAADRIRATNFAALIAALVDLRNQGKIRIVPWSQLAYTESTVESNMIPGSFEWNLTAGAPADQAAAVSGSGSEQLPLYLGNGGTFKLVTAATMAPHTGTYCMQVVSDGDARMLYYSIPLRRSTPYELSFWSKAPANAIHTIQIDWQSGITSTQIAHTQVTNNDWEKVTIPINMLEDANSIDLNIYFSTAATYYIDDIKLV